MNVPGEPLLSPCLLLASISPPWRGPEHSLPWPGVKLYRLGRDALAAAVATLRPGLVLMPAYVCREAAEGLLLAGREVRYYALGPALNPDWAVLDTLPTDAAALVLVHYFGFPADTAAARRWCDERGVALIEDCAHSFLGTVEGRRAGSHGDFAVFSFRKHLPVASGAALVIHRPADGYVPLTHAPASPGGLGLLPALRKAAAWAVFVSGSARLRVWFAPALSDERGLQAAKPGDGPGMDWTTRRVVARLSGRFDRIARRRRENYVLLERELSGCAGVTSLLGPLPVGAVPWGFPLRVERGPKLRDGLLATLLHEGIGAWSWPDLPEEVTEATFPAEWRLAQETVALPVHQDLSPAQVQHIADTVAAWALT